MAPPTGPKFPKGVIPGLRAYCQAAEADAGLTDDPLENATRAADNYGTALLVLICDVPGALERLNVLTAALSGAVAERNKMKRGPRRASWPRQALRPGRGGERG